MINKKKVLIIKTGHCEILDKGNNSRKVSLGDILRTTVILHPYKNDEITWVTDQEAFPLFEGNPFIKEERLLPYDFTTALQLESEEFDTVINLEKIPGICALSDKIKSRRNKYGFNFNTQNGEAEAFEDSLEILAFGADPTLKKSNKKTIQELLFKMVGKKWKGEEYVLGFQPSSKEKYSVGLNTNIGAKWPNKAWSTNNWNELESLLKTKNISVTRQDKQPNGVLTNLKEYMNWINSSKTIITNDSLGLHLGIALKKNVLGLFGPTPDKEVHFYGRGQAILPEENLGCLPCFKPTCPKYENSCIDLISPEKVFKNFIENTKKNKIRKDYQTK